MNFFVARIAARPPLSLLCPARRSAHTGIGATSGFAHGFAHPVGGLDHVLAMVAVGLYAALLGGRALWLVPASFVGVMAIGGALGMAGVTLPHIEFGIALSVIVLGLAVALRISLPMLVARRWSACSRSSTATRMAPRCRDVSAIAYAAGFLLATALLHGVGDRARLAGRLGDQWLARDAGRAAARSRLRALRSCCTRSDRAGLSSSSRGVIRAPCYCE